MTAVIFDFPAIGDVGGSSGVPLAEVPRQLRPRTQQRSAQDQRLARSGVSLSETSLLCFSVVIVIGLV